MDLSRRTFLKRAGALAVAATVAPIRRRDRSQVRIGVVGGGFGAAFQWHLHPRCKVAAVSDLRDDRRDLLRKVYGCELAYPSLSELVKDSSIDAVAIFTEATHHARHVVEAMEAGKHVISAVPLATSLEECRAVAAAVRRSGRRYMMAETSWYRPETMLARDLHRAGEFGRLVYTEAEYYHPGICHDAHDLSHVNGQRTWRYGFPPLHYPTHATAFLVGVTGERLIKVSALGWGSGDDALRDNDYANPFWNGSALFRTSGGFLCRCNVFWHVNADGERAQWLGEKLALYMAGSGGQPFRRVGADGKSSGELPDYKERLPEPLRVESGHGGSHPHLTHEFVTALITEREPAIDLAESLAMTVPGIVAHESALKGGVQLDVPALDGS
jgi:predicted dehydrogenase